MLETCEKALICGLLVVVVASGTVIAIAAAAWAVGKALGACG
jgi:hypothetical protein